MDTMKHDTECKQFITFTEKQNPFRRCDHKAKDS